MIKATALCVLSFIIGTAHAQNIMYDWSIGIGGGNYESGRSIAVDSNGDIYSSGTFVGTVDFDPGPGTYNLNAPGITASIFIMKSDSSGNLIWAKMVNANGGFARSMTVDATGNVYATGYFFETTDFDPGSGIYNLTAATSTLSTNDIFILKLDTDGNFILARRIGGQAADEGFSIALDPDGNIYTTGYFIGNVDFDPDTGSYYLPITPYATTFICKLDSNANFVWAKSLPGPSITQGNSIYVNSIGEVYTTGHFYLTVDFDPGPGIYNLTANGSFDIFMIKLDSSGNFAWAKSIGGGSGDMGTQIKGDAPGNVYLSGFFNAIDTIDFDPGPGIFNLTISPSGSNCFILKLDAGGNFVWAQHNPGTSGPQLNVPFALDADGNIFLSGYFLNTRDFNSGNGTYFLSSHGEEDIFIYKLDSAGNYAWAKQMGGHFEDMCYSIAVDDLGNVYTTGVFTDTANFDPSGTANLISGGLLDAFVVKYVPCTSPLSSQNVTACGNYVWYNDTLTVSGVYSTTIPNPPGCDSIVSINLTINTVDVSVTDNAPTLLSNASGATYQWIYCDSVAITGATGQSFTATSNGSFAVIVSQNGCTDTSDCFVVTNVGMNEQSADVPLKLYPNPSTGSFQILSDHVYNHVTVIIKNVLGQIISAHHFDGHSELLLNIERESGLYFVEVMTDDGKTRYLKLIRN